MVENAANGSVEAVNARIIRRHLGSSQRLPEVDVLSALGVRGGSSHHPRMGAFTIGAHAYVSVQAEPEKQIAQENGMVFRISTALILIRILKLKKVRKKSGKVYYKKWEKKSGGKLLTRDRKDCMECQTSTFSLPGASILWKGIRETKRAACSGESKSLSAIIGAIRQQTGL